MSNKVLIYLISGILIVAAAGFALWRFNGQQQDEKEFGKQAESALSSPLQASTPTPSAAEPTPPAPNLTPTADRCERKFDAEKLKTAKVEIKNRQVEIKVKGFGSLVLALDDQAAPKTVENFLRLTNAGFYDCLTFHRVAKDFVIQGGDPQGTGQGGPGYTVPAEIKLPHKKGSLAMARLPDQVNPQKESSGSQFYIALNDLPQLDGAYTVFGQIVKGLGIAEKIGLLATNPPGDGAPKQPVVMEAVKIIK